MTSGLRPDGSLAGLLAPWARARFERPAVELAEALLGALLVRAGPAGTLETCLIVETEAYGGPEDRASHARAGRTRRTAPMFGPAGHAYVYLVYGMHHCLNVVSDGDGQAGAVLLRAAEPGDGLATMRARRGPAAGPDHRLLAGPARLCQGLMIDRGLDGHDLAAGTALWIADPDPRTAARIAAAGIVTGPRVGVAYAGADWAGRPWRFGVRGHPSLSRPLWSPDGREVARAARIPPDPCPPRGLCRVPAVPADGGGARALG
ncbi:MAG: DNA-3-methyladenine glycosylase [Chloroflexota bacterium]